jgi:hypothetical protein
MPPAKTDTRTGAAGDGLDKPEFGELEELDEVEELSEIEELDDAGGTTVSFGATALSDDTAVDFGELEDLEEAEDPGDIEEFGELEELDEFEETAEDDETPLEPALRNTPPSPSFKSNVQLVFGEDDIPTIVETSGLELVDDLTDGINFDDELEELEKREAAKNTSKPKPPTSRISIRNVDVASQIEFGSSQKPDDGADFVDRPDVVIVSPFENMFSGLGKTSTVQTEKSEEKHDSDHLEEIYGSMSLVHVPFQDDDSGEPEELQVADACIIKRKNGVNYVDEKVKTPDSHTAKSLDPGFKNLVDSVIRP